MKKLFLMLCCSAIFSISSIGRITTPIQYTSYEVNGVITYDIRGSVPGSSILFYSKPWGGDILKEITTDAAGHAIVAWSGQKAPAFVLNKPTANGKGISGNGMVAFTPEKDFSLSDIGTTSHEGSMSIRWNASVSNPDFYAFEVLKSINGTDYSLVKTIPAQTTDKTDYMYNEQLPLNTSATYKIQIRNINGVILYASTPIHEYNFGEISVYPTIVKNTINIRLTKHSNCNYRIMDAQGKVLSAGTLSNDQNSIDVLKLLAGNYFIQVSNGENKMTSKFIKE